MRDDAASFHRFIVCLSGPSTYTCSVLLSDLGTTRVAVSHVVGSSFDGADAGDSITLSHWVDESLLDPVSESSSGAHIPPSSQWGSFGNHFPLLCGSSDWEQASAMVHSAQPHDYQLGNQVPCSLAFDDGGKTVPLAGPIPFQAPESAFWSFKPPERPLVFPTPSDLHYLQNTGGQYYPNQVSANDTHEYWRELYMVMCLAGVPIQAGENAHSSIEPHQMHLDNPTLPSEVEIEPAENDTFQSQIAPSSSTTVEQLPLQTPSGGRERRRASKYETPNSIVLETAASQ
ncbi:hypothetical protein RSAG8_00397, partial [Rhizoctonia solani AG-8 WAC10335]